LHHGDIRSVRLQLLEGPLGFPQLVIFLL
jgi:hypothetical protein